MLVERLRLTRFRNYEALDLKPENGMNVILGENAQGKTNAVEAVFLCAFGRSQRTPRDAELIMHGYSGAYVGLDIKTSDGRRSVELKIPAGERKQIFIDRVKAERTSELMGVFNAVMFSPDDLELVKGAPSERRRYIDMELSQYRPAYYVHLQRYGAALRQRNALLKNERGLEFKQLKHELYSWDEILASEGAEIMLMRLEFIDSLSKIAYDVHNVLSGRRGGVNAKYLPSVPFDRPGDVRDRLYDALYGGAADDMRRGFTGAGPHRDDMDLLMDDGKPLRIYGSQGQQRTAALALKLSEMVLFRADKGEPPVLILDDVLSELDERRQRALLEAISGCQCFLTCTSLDGLKRAGGTELKLFSCSAGKIERMEKA